MNLKTKRQPNKSMRSRSYVLVFVFTVIFAALLVCHLFKISVIDHDTYVARANERHFGNISIPAERGAIYDKNGTPLAWSATVYKVYIDPSLYRTQIEKIEKNNKQILSQNKSKDGTPKGYVDTTQLQNELITYLSEKLSISTDEIVEAINKDSKYVVLKKQVEKPDADEILAYMDNIGLSCINTESDTKRYYTQNELAAAVIGFTNASGDGQYGIESYYDNYLAGTDGRVLSAKDANGNVMPYRDAQTYDAINGDDLYLTIDITMQYYLEKNLEDMCEDFNIQDRACGIIMNAKTGAIYAMASCPGFDLNDPSTIYDSKKAEELSLLTGQEYDDAYAEAREEQWKNKAVQEIYTPGSVFKSFTAAAALEENAVDLDTYSYTCTGSTKVMDAELWCSHRSGHGTETFQQAMTNSCNPAFIDIAFKLGDTAFDQYFRSFGLNEKTGIDLPGESGSIFYDYDSLGAVELASESFGQSTKLSAIQMITGYAAIINGGELVTPYVVGEIKDSDGNTVKKNTKNVKRQVISKETSEKMRSILENVVEDSPKSNSYIAGYKIGGKTGTSQKNDMYNIENEAAMQYVASYCCFAPADDPEIVMLILADEPDKSIGYYGSQVVVPYATKVLEEVLPYLGYYPEYSDSDYSSLTTQVPSVSDMNLTDAQEILADSDISYKVIGDGDYVSKQSPSSGSVFVTGGSVILYTGESEVETTTVPNVVGMTLTAAKSLIYDNGLNMFISDVGNSDSELVVTSQSIESGTEANKGTVLSLTLGTGSSSDDDDDDDDSDAVNNNEYVAD